MYVGSLNMPKVLIIISSVLLLCACASNPKNNEASLSSINTFSRTPASRTDNCSKTGVDKLFPHKYSQASGAWCQDSFRAVYMVETLLSGIKKGTVTFHEGNTVNFTALALGGYVLEGGMFHKNERGTFISVRFTYNGEKNSTNYYHFTYKVDASMIGPGQVDVVLKTNAAGE